MSISDIDDALRSTDEERRWAAAGAAGELTSTQPEALWALIAVHGSSPIDDLRSAVATCMLEHLLEERFQEYFPLLEKEVLAGNVLLGDTLRRSWKLGQAAEPESSARWDNLISAVREALPQR